ncbi:unnamed protein product [Protopolystoma xenopodis]|uniref:Uncharacterized protein n=1 Tax=Protopolystoma xenopodis TaxID=117903 RepID=A0A448WK38_9PLAT|nr:unnamed protein product [Protopolystoma xenopodis]
MVRGQFVQPAMLASGSGGASGSGFVRAVVGPGGIATLTPGSVGNTAGAQMSGTARLVGQTLTPGLLNPSGRQTVAIHQTQHHPHLQQQHAPSQVMRAVPLITGTGASSVITASRRIGDLNLPQGSAHQSVYLPTGRPASWQQTADQFHSMQQQRRTHTLGHAHHHSQQQEPQQQSPRSGGGQN